MVHRRRMAQTKANTWQTVLQCDRSFGPGQPAGRDSSSMQAKEEACSSRRFPNEQSQVQGSCPHRSAPVNRRTESQFQIAALDSRRVGGANETWTPLQAQRTPGEAKACDLAPTTTGRQCCTNLGANCLLEAQSCHRGTRSTKEDRRR